MKKDTDKKLVIEQLKKNPLVQIACEKVGVVRATYYRWRKEDSEFASLTDAALLEGRSLVNDLAESQLMSAIKDKNISAIIFWLRNNHPTYANTAVVSILQAFRSSQPTMEILLFSGRSARARAQTESWLTQHVIPYDLLVMRAVGDERKDATVKREMYEEHISGKRSVWFVLDDRDQVIDLWRRELGLRCLQVNYGQF